MRVIISAASGVFFKFEIFKVRVVVMCYLEGFDRDIVSASVVEYLVLLECH